MSKVFQMHGGSGGSIKLASIEITTPPTKTAYKAGEQFSTAGMVVKATYSNGATLIATGVSVEPSGGLEAGRTSVTIRYTEGGVSCTATQAVTVTKTNVTVPSQSGSLTYSGSSQSPAWYNYDTAKMTLGGTTSGTNAGTYSAKFTLKDTALYQWAFGFAGFTNWPGIKLFGVSFASSSALAIAPFMPFAPSERTSSAPYAFISCRRSTDMVSGMTMMMR